ncbi:MAG: 2Fe-2S iron-sulfur cluster-binding protein [Chitinophagales bacterium]
MYKITVKFEESDKETQVIEVEPDYSILEGVLMNDIDLHHNCGGVCACTTCHIYLTKGDDFVEEISDKEEDYVDRAIQPRLESRLGCQCILLEGSGEIEITIPDQRNIIGHEH